MVYARRFSLVFMAGFTALAVALAASLVTQGIFFSVHPLAISLRGFGLGYMLAGFGLWIAACRDCGDNPNLNSMFNILIPAGCIALLVSVLAANNPGMATLLWTGISLNAAALLIGLGAQIVDPVHPCPLAVSWPEGGDCCRDPHVPATERTQPEGHATLPNDLTVIAGIDSTYQDALHQSGIVTFDSLGRQNVDRLVWILEEYALPMPEDLQHWISAAGKAALQQ